MSKLIQEQYESMIETDITYGQNRYAKWLEAARSANPRMDAITESTIVKMLKNTEGELIKRFGHQQVKSFFETSTKPSDIDSFINYAFDMVTAMIPANPIAEFAGIQGIDKRVGEIFYMDIIKASTKGSHVADTKYLDSQTGPNTGSSYSDEYIDHEDLYTGDGTAGTGTLIFSGAILDWRPIKPYDATTEYTGIILTFTISSTTFTVQDTDNGDGTGTFTDATNIASASINYATGALNVTFASAKAPDDTTKVWVAYYQNSAREDVNQSPEVIVKLSSVFVTAKRRFLNTRWMIDSAIMLSKEHGKDINAELVDKVLSGVMNEIAIEAADKLLADAGANGGAAIDFDKTPPDAAIPYVVHRQEIVGTTGVASTTIESEVRKVTANFVIAGKDYINVVKGLPRDMFDSVAYADKTPVGMHVIGVLDNQWKVIQNFDYANDKFLIGAKGPDWLTTGFVYSPYIPLMTTPVNWNLAGDHWRSLLTWYGMKTINTKFYHRGIISAS